MKHLASMSSRRPRPAPTMTSGISSARANRGNHTSDVKFQSFVRGGAGGFVAPYTVGSRAPTRFKETGNNGVGGGTSGGGGAPYASVISSSKVQAALQTSRYATYNPSLETQDVESGARLLRGQAVKHFLNHVRPQHLYKIERFLKEELAKHPKHSSKQPTQLKGLARRNVVTSVSSSSSSSSSTPTERKRSSLDDLERLSIVSTAWQALNDCLPQFQGTLEDMREMYDAKVDHLRLSLSFIGDEEEDAARLPPVSDSSSNAASEEASSASSSSGATKQSVTKRTRRSRDQSIISSFESGSSDEGRRSSRSSSTENQELGEGKRERVAGSYKSSWSPAGSASELKSFWEDVVHHHAKQVKTPATTIDFIQHLRLNLLPCMMTCYHEVSRHVSEQSKVRGLVLEKIWHRAMSLIASICRHAKRMRMHHIKVVESLDHALSEEKNFLRKNENSTNHYNHTLTPDEIDEQENFGSKLRRQETELSMLKERKNALSRVRKTLQSLVSEYTKRRHTEMADAEKIALEEHISTVTLGSLSSAMERQQDRLRKAELAAVNADLLSSMQRVHEMLDDIKQNIRRSLGSSSKRNASIQVDASDQSWTVEVSSSRKMAPSQGWWTLHRGNGNENNRRKKGKEGSVESYDLAIGMNEKKSVPIPAMFQRVLTLGSPKTQVRSMAKITFDKTVMAIYESMLEVWEEGGGQVRRGGDRSRESSTTIVAVHGWDVNTTVSDFVYDYLLLQFGIAELSEPKLLQLLATSYRLRKKSKRSKLFALVCGLTPPVDERGRTVHALHDRYHEDALNFMVGTYSALRQEHGTGRCIEISKKSLYYAELDVALIMAEEIFYTETDKELQSMADSIRNMQQLLVAEKSMLGLDRRNANHQVGKSIPVVAVDALLDMWTTKWTGNVASSLNRYKILFVASDVNEDGSLSYREFSTAIKGLDPNVESFTIAELFRGCLRSTQGGGAEIDCNSFAYHMTRNTDYMAPMRWEGRAELNVSSNSEGSRRSGGGGNGEDDDDDEEGKEKERNSKDLSCIQMYGTAASHSYSDVSRSVRLLREDWSRWQSSVKKHLEWIMDHAKTPDEKWDSEHCMKRFGHFERLFEHALDGPDNAELAWQAYRLLRHQTETLRKDQTMLSHAMAPIHLISRFKKKMLNVAKRKVGGDSSGNVDAAESGSVGSSVGSESGKNEVGSDGIISDGVAVEDSETNKIALAFSSVRWHHVDKLVGMLDFGVVDINVVNHQGSTLLHTACQNGHLDIVRRLCRKGIDMNCQNNKGNTAMHFSRYYDYDDIFRYLRSQGANDALRNIDGETCYEKMASSGMY